MAVCGAVSVLVVVMMLLEAVPRRVAQQLVRGREQVVLLGVDVGGEHTRRPLHGEQRHWVPVGSAAAAMVESTLACSA